MTYCGLCYFVDVMLFGDFGDLFVWYYCCCLGCCWWVSGIYCVFVLVLQAVS